MDLQMRKDLLRCYYASGNSPVAALRQYKLENGLRKDPCVPHSITNLVQKFEETASLLDAPHTGRKSKEEERSDAVSAALVSTSNEQGSTSVSRMSVETGIPRASVWRILHHQLHLHPYKLQLHQEITEMDKVARKEFAAWLLENPTNIPSIFWSDEAIIHLDGEINRHNCRIWNSVKPTEVLTTTLHPIKVCVWFGFSAAFSLTPYFFDSSVNSKSYLQMLQEHVRPQLAHKKKLSSVTFMQDGAPAHYAKAVREYLIQQFTPDRVISRGCLHTWPPRSPDLTPLDFWFWGTLKSRVFHHNQPQNLETLKERIREECELFTPEEFAAAVANVPKRMECVLHAEGDHIEQYF
jgi:hypothetical protein